MNRERTLIFLALVAGLSGKVHAEQDCEGLKKLTLMNTTITAAESHAADVAEFAVRGPSGAQIPPLKADLPSYCRVTGVIRPTNDSEIRFELWMPLQGWNHRYQQTGNGGFAGSILVANLIEPLQQGWAVAGTDDGHVGASMADGRWAPGHPEKVVDYGYRAVHLTAHRARAIVQAFYNAKAAHSYFVGCSDGGRESLMEAQRYPQDFDGFLAGAPAIDFASLAVGAAHRVQTAKVLGPYALNPAQIALLRERALDRCDALDGVKDGVIGDPRRCGFKPQELLCKGAQKDGCLTQTQVDAVQKIYDGPSDPKTGKTLAYGYSDTVGTDVPALDGADATAALGQQLLGSMVYGDSNLDLQIVDLAKASRDARKLARIVNPSSVDLRTVRRAGKKIIQYHGWADPIIPAESSLAYFDSVQKSLGDTQDFYRLFMVPGMAHCGGGVGPAWITGTAVAHDAQHDAVSALTRWVEEGIAPEQIIATEFVGKVVDPMNGPAAGTPVKSTRPICAYPKVATYKGGGNTGDAMNFECKLQ